jgi:hypothetical protein
MRNNGRFVGGPGLAGPGQDIVQGANGMLGSSAVQEDRWPYWWAVPRSNTQYVQKVACMPAPVAGVLTQVINPITGAAAEVDVPPGFCFILRAIRQGFSTGIGGAPVWVEGSGDILWTVDVDVPLGAIALSGFSLPDLANMADARGSAVAPWPLEGYTVFEPYQTIRYKVLTTVNIGAGAPNFITCGLFGWLEKQLL